MVRSTPEKTDASEYGLMGRLTAKPGQREKLIELLLQAAGYLREVPGCRHWIVHESLDAPDDVWITEMWRSRQDHAASLARPEIREVITTAMPLLLAPPTKGQETLPRGGVGAQHLGG